MIPLKSLEWNVIVGDFNSKEIETYNIFDHWRFKEDCDKNWKRHKKDRAAFEDALKTDMMYYFWSKSEWEVIIQHWPPSERYKDKKIDVYEQVRLNWDIFVDYVWKSYSERRSCNG